MIRWFLEKEGRSDCKISLPGEELGDVDECRYLGESLVRMVLGQLKLRVES